MDYKVYEDGRLESGSVKYEIPDVIVGDAVDVEKWLRANMKPGDTYQYIYENSQTEVQSYEYMVWEWDRDNAHACGDWDGMSDYPIAAPSY